MEWQPIETAPKDGARILGYGRMAYDNVRECSIATVKWCTTYNRWECAPNEASEYDPESCDLTHWMPLPSPPQENSEPGAS